MYSRCSPFVLIVALPLIGVGGAAEPAAQAPPQISCSGKVLDVQGRPISDAKVVLYEVNYGAGDAFPKAHQTQATVTGADGAFRFTAPKLSEGYRQGCVTVQKQGLSMSWITWEMREGDVQADVTLGEPRELGGTVVDEGGTPIVDAEVSIAVAIIGNEQDRRYLAYYIAPQLLTVRTDSAGRFAFSNLPAEATCELLVRKDGRATIYTLDTSTYRGGKCQFAPGRTDIKMTLPVEARIEGRVVDAGGKPVGGVQVAVQPDQRVTPFMGEPVTSAPDGTFFIGNLAAGGYVVQLPRRPQEVADWVAESVKLNLKAGETVRGVQLSLSKGGLVEVLVKEETGGKPVEKVNVNIRSEAQNQWYGGVTDANGVVRIRLVPGVYQLSGIYSQNYVRSDEREEFTIAEGETKQIERMLRGLPAVNGVVYDDADKPLEGVKVQVLPGGFGKDTVSDAEGKFEARWDPQGWPADRTVFYLVARYPDRNLAVAQPMEEKAGSMEVKLCPAATLTGQVVDPNGKAIEGAQLQIMLETSNWGSSFLPYRSVKTDAEGKFEIGAIPPEQRYGITAMADGYGQTRIDLSQEQVTTGRVEAGSFSLPLANLSVSGVVVDSEGNPVPGARLSCYGSSRDNQPNRNTQADAEGRFTLDGVCAGPISISADGQSGSIALRAYVQTEGGAGNIRIVMTEGSAQRQYAPGRPATLKGKPLPDLKKLGIELPPEAEGKVLLVCFWDMNQRPSRYCMSELIRRAPEMAERGWVIVAIHAGQVGEGALEQWVETNKPPFPVSRLTGDLEKTRFQWGAASLPHLILTDQKHFVAREGFALLAELDK